jgi:hypothetical protein
MVEAPKRPDRVTDSNARRPDGILTIREATAATEAMVRLMHEAEQQAAQRLVLADLRA